MKKLSVALGAMVVMAMVAHAQDTVTSVNVVGYISGQQPKDSFELLSLDFDIINGTNVIGDVLDPSSLPSGTAVLMWDKVQQQYGATETVITFPSTKWNPGTNVLNRGDAFWVKMPSGASDTNVVTTMGEVPQDKTDVVLTPGFSFVAYPYPSSVSITNANIPAKSGDTLLWWNGSGWETETYITFPSTKWNPGEYVLEPGEGFLYKSLAVTNKMWSPELPY